MSAPTGTLGVAIPVWFRVMGYESNGNPWTSKYNICLPKVKQSDPNTCCLSVLWWGDARYPVGEPCLVWPVPVAPAPVTHCLSSHQWCAPRVTPIPARSSPRSSGDSGPRVRAGPRRKSAPPGPLLLILRWERDTDKRLIKPSPNPVKSEAVHILTNNCPWRSDCPFYEMSLQIFLS